MADSSSESDEQRSKLKKLKRHHKSVLKHEEAEGSKRRVPPHGSSENTNRKRSDSGDEVRKKKKETHNHPNVHKSSEKYKENVNNKQFDVKKEPLSSDEEGLKHKFSDQYDRESSLRERLKQKYKDHEKRQIKEQKKYIETINVIKRKKDSSETYFDSNVEHRESYRSIRKDSHKDKQSNTEKGHRKHDFESRSEHKERDDDIQRQRKCDRDREVNNKMTNRREERRNQGRYREREVNSYEHGKPYDRDNEKHHGSRNSNRHSTREWDRSKNGSQWDERNTTEREYGQSNEISSTNIVNKVLPKKEEPDFKLSGKLTEYTNTYNGVVIMYNEPVEARRPKTKWRLYPFKEEKALPMLQLHRQSAFLFGRDRKIADIPVDHPSCSKQHAVLQFRLVDYERPDGAIGRKVKPYVIDLESTNGTFVNNNKVDSRRYIELIEKDIVKFGFSSREYVLLHEKSRDDDPESDDGEEKGEGEGKEENEENKS